MLAVMGASSPDMADALSRGLNAAGINVVDVGLVATPMLMHMLDAPGAIMVTGLQSPGLQRFQGGAQECAVWADDTIAWVPGSRG